MTSCVLSRVFFPLSLIWSRHPSVYGSPPLPAPPIDRPFRSCPSITPSSPAHRPPPTSFYDRRYHTLNSTLLSPDDTTTPPPSCRVTRPSATLRHCPTTHQRAMPPTPPPCSATAGSGQATPPPSCRVAPPARQPHSATTTTAQQPINMLRHPPLHREQCHAHRGRTIVTPHTQKFPIR
jgi:hypothetical protein